MKTQTTQRRCKTCELADEFALALWNAMPYDHVSYQSTVQTLDDAERIVRRVLAEKRIALRLERGGWLRRLVRWVGDLRLMLATARDGHRDGR